MKATSSAMPSPGETTSWSHRELFHLLFSRSSCLERLGKLEKADLSWRTSSEELNRITDLFLDAVPFASKVARRDRAEDRLELQREAQSALESCEQWTPSKIREWLSKGAIVGPRVLQRALEAKASAPAIEALLGGGIIPTDAHLKVPLSQNRRATLKQLLDAGVRPSPSLVEELAQRGDETCVDELIGAGGFSKALATSNCLGRLQRTTARYYAMTESFFQRGERGRTLILNMIKTGKSPVATWMVHRAFQESSPDSKLVQELLQLGAPATPHALARACASNAHQLAESLLERGALPPQLLAEQMVALWPPKSVEQHFAMIFPVKGETQITRRALALAVRFSSPEVIRLMLKRGTPSNCRILARAMLRGDCDASLLKALIPKTLPSDAPSFFGRFQRWGVLWSPTASISPLLKVRPDEETLAAAIMRSRSDVVAQLIAAGAPITGRIKRLALGRCHDGVSKTVRILARQDPVELCKLAVSHGSVGMVTALLKGMGSIGPKQREELLKAALLRPDGARGLTRLFLDPDAPLPKELIYSACEEAHLSAIQTIYSSTKVTRYAVERALRRPDGDPKAALWLLRKSHQVDSDLPNRAFLALPHDPKRLRAFWKLMASLKTNQPFKQWVPDPLVIEITELVLGKRGPHVEIVGRARKSKGKDPL